MKKFDFTISNQLTAMGKRIAMVLTLLLTMGIGELCGAPSARYFLIGEPTGSWDKNNNCKIQTRYEKDGQYVLYIYASKDCFFRLKKDDGADYGPSSNQSTSQGYGAYNTNAWKYNGNAGIVRFGVDETAGDNGEHYPYVFWEKVDIKIKHGWNGGDWTIQDMIAQSDGTYTYIGQYSGTNGANFGIEGSGATFKYISNATLVGSPSKGNKCLFTYNSAGYKGYGTETQNTGSATITRLYTITYNGNGHTGGTVPAAIDKKHGTSITLSSSIPTRTGYTFAGWNTKADGSGTTYAKGATYSTNADVTLYAKWTANTYTVTFNKQSGTGGTNSVTATYDATMPSATMPTRTGYTFNGYFDATSGGTKYYNANGTSARTWNKTAATTLYAQWTENKYNVVISTDGNGTTNQTGTKSIGIVGISITATPKIGSAFKQWEVTGGAKVANATSVTTTITATSAGTVKAVFEEKPATTIYLEPTGHWNPDKAVFQAHVWQTGKTGVNLDMVGIGDPSHADGDNKSPYRYYKVEVPYGYDKILFFRKDNFATANANAWNKTGDLTIPTDNQTLYVITNNEVSPATGTWKAANLVYTITLGYCDFGTYGIKYNGQSYFSKKPNDNVTIDVPAGAQIEILEGQPFSNAYKGYVIKSKPTEVELNIGQTLTVNGDIMLDDNFVTKESHVVYLGVPDGLTDWTSGTYGNFLWSWNTMSSFSLIASTRNFKIANTTYYEYTIPAGRHSLCFQRKTGVNDTGTPQKESVYLPFQIPLNEVNCFTLQDKKDGTRYKGTWGTLPAKQGDHRLLYIEQKVGLENGHPKTTVTKDHPSDIIRQGDTRDTYSLHIYNEVENGENGMNDPEILLQECTGYDGVNPIWTTRERHMVFGPSHAEFGMAAMPGRRDAGGDPDAVLRYDNGIENIKNDLKNIQAYNPEDPTTHFYIGKDNPTAEDYQTYIDNFKNDECSGVWNFIVTRDGSKNFKALDLTQTARYEGDYYVRTDCADGGWDRYTLNGNHMTRSDISKRNSNYSHYYCKWIDQEGTNVTYIIANDYGMAISDTLIADETDIWGTPIADAQKIVTGKTLPTNNEYGGANIRFSWNEKTDSLHRAYLAGSTDVSSRFLVLEGQSGQLYDAEGQALTQGANGSDRYGLKANEEIFTDISNWVYYADVQLVPNAGLKLTAKYMDKVQYFVGQADQYNNTVLAGTGSQKYLIRLLYDFKTNELISAYVPGGQAGKEIEAIETNLMLIRKENAAPTQLSFNTNNMRDVGKQAYGVLELTKATLIDNTQDKNIYERSLYWISFPFDVRITDIFGFGEYGKHWIIQSYNGAKRAANGLFLDSDTNWEYHFDPNTLNAGTPDQGIMKRGVGYVVALDLDQINADNPFVGRITTIALYFPSTNTITEHIVNKSEVIITVPEHVCTINRNTPNGDRRVKDSHWNVIGVPSYINAEGNFGSIEGKFDHIELENRPQELQFYYRWLGDHDKYEVTTPSATVNFNSLTAYMVQYAGDLTWTSVLNEGPASLAAKRNSDDMKQHHLRLELQQNGTEQDRTFIQLQEDEVTAGFDFNYDLCKINNSGANIYTLIATDTYPVEVAGNVMPVQETVIPVGIKLDAAGEYTFAMPDGTDGIVAELIDYEANTTTNLLFSDYTVSLPKGTNENRFALSVKPDKTATSLENIFNDATGDEVKKFIIDGVLYMQKDGVLYDAQGHIVR